MHPYEINVTEMAEIPYPVPKLLRWSQSTNRKSVRSKLQRLLSTFRFVTMGQAYHDLNTRIEVGLDLAKHPIAYGNAA
jgi:hypothetical protein